MINRVNYKLSYFRKIRNYITLEAAEMVYKNTILPIHIWYPSSSISGQSAQMINLTLIKVKVT